MKRIFVILLGLILLSISVPAQTAGHSPDALMLRFPDVSSDNIVFVYAGDLWLVSKQGGTAAKLSSPEGAEMFPKFSPDGSMIAFSGNYDGNTDVYIMPAAGGSPLRLTHHPSADYVVEWYPDGKNVLFRTGMTSPSRRFHQLYKQSIKGGLPGKLPMQYGELGSFNSDGSKIAFQIISREFRTWKRYRGGMASDLWLYDLKNNTSEKLTTFDGTDALPMWHGNTIYFLSDRDNNKKLNIWSYNVNSKQFKQVTFFDEFDVKWPSLGPADIVFENGGKLYLLDLGTEKAKEISIRVPSDLPSVRTKLKSVSKYIASFSISPSGKRAVFEARGDIFTVPEKHGSVKNITASSGAAERTPAWSPDGKYIAYFSDKTGEYQLYLKNGDGSGKAKQVTTSINTFVYNPVWSPDSKMIAYRDKAGRLFVVSIDNGTPKQIDKNDYNEFLNYKWSSDSKWLAYDKPSSNRLSAIYIYNIDTEKSNKVTTDFYNDTNPVFDPEGKYLYFYSDRNFSPIYSDFEPTWVYPNATELYAITLQKDEPSLLAPQSDEEKVKKDEKETDDKKSEKSETESEGKNKEKETKEVKIDFSGIEKRVVKIPVDIGNVGPLYAVKGKILFLKNPASGAAKPGKPSGTLKYYDIEKRESEDIIKGISTYKLSANGKKIIYRSNSAYGIIDVSKGKKVGDGKISTSDLKMFVEPQKEWRQIFNEAWRTERDYFYDPNMHGVDWEKIKKRYETLLPYIVDRSDLNYIIGEMIAELNTSHSYVGGGDTERPKTINVGLLGVDFELDGKMFKIKKIYEPPVWDYAEARSPLQAPGISVKEGEYLVAVNGKSLNTSEDPWTAFQGLAGEVVTLSVNSKPSADGARDIIVKPMRSEYNLRHSAWIESNRIKVDKATDGKVGYIYVPNTGVEGQTELLRQFVPQWNKDALIIDERFNSGGQIPDRFIELLNRPLYNYWARHGFKSAQTPSLSNVGPKVMLINGWAGSGGDAFPSYFRKAGLGPLIGKRTWGGLIGYGGNPSPVDRGRLTAPSFGYFGLDGKWAIEGYGVAPDIEVENYPHELAAGKDAQLQKGIEVIMKMLKENPPQHVKKPEYPDRSK